MELVEDYRDCVTMLAKLKDKMETDEFSFRLGKRTYLVHITEITKPTEDT